MINKSVPFNKLGFSNLFNDYLAEKSEILSFYEKNPFKTESYSQLAKSRDLHTDRESLVNALLSFNESFNPPQKTIDSIHSLKSPGTFTVVTGQQMTFAGGPLFTLYKTITAILLSKYLTNNSNLNVVPVFWLADEDHDFEEIADFKGEKNGKIETIFVDKKNVDNHAAGKLVFDDAGETLSRLEALLPDSEFKANAVSILESCWQNGSSWRTAFGKQMLDLFSGYGLILCGSDSKEIKELVKPVFRFGLEKKTSVYEALENQSQELENNYHRQAYVGDSQLFLHTSTGREKVDFSDIADISELSSKCDASPEIFSPNVFFRPLLQEYLLPNLAYIGGPAEVAYFGQMNTLFKEAGLTMPMIVPRMSATIIEPPVARLLPEFGFNYEDYKERIEVLEKKYVHENTDADIHKSINKWIKDIKAIYESNIDFISSVDPSLVGSVHSAASKAENEVQKIRQKVIRSLKQREEVQLKRIKKIKGSLFPDDNLQERELSYIHYYAKYGENLITLLLNSLDNENLLEELKEHHLIYLD